VSILEVEDLRVSFFLGKRVLQVIDGLSLSVDAGETVGLVGESGSGKTVTASAIVGLLRRPGRITGGQVRWEGTDLVAGGEPAFARVRGKGMTMIFQNAKAALNPVLSVGDQFEQVLRVHRGLKGSSARAEAVRMLRLVHVGDPEMRLRTFPHELSGGTAQRITLAIALSCGSRLVIADEPTSSLDVTVQSQIIRLFREIREQTGLAMLLITHDLALASELCDRIAVLYAGRLAEVGPLRQITEAPSHPYTSALFAARPALGVQVLPTIPGGTADLSDPPPGCRFHPRCPSRIGICPEVQPALLTDVPGHAVACHNPLRSSDGAMTGATE
jgi:oligopeptide/dipeptide ABC transporter ATP-binding protein